MKKLLTAIAILIATTSFSQAKVVVEQDTIKYKDQKFYAGKEFHTYVGSGSDKAFQWIIVSAEKYSNVKPLYPVYSKSKFVVEKIYNTNRGWSVLTRLPDLTKKDGSVIKGELVFFVVERAVDNKEVVVE
jgi:hypothetical protein